MREIKFRGISRETNQFVCGMLMYSTSDSGLVIVETHDIPPSMQDPCGDTINVYHGIKQGTESEYIGIEDDAGIEIYEGDIVIINTISYKKRNVVFRNGSFKIEHGSGLQIVSYHIGEFKSNELQVVGNIFEK